MPWAAKEQLRQLRTLLKAAVREKCRLHLWHPGLGALTVLEEAEICSNSCQLPLGNVNVSEGSGYSKEKTRLFFFLPDGTAHVSWGENVGACAGLLLAEQFPASPMPRELVHPETPLATLDTAGLSMVSLCALVPPPCSALGS